MNNWPKTVPLSDQYKFKPNTTYQHQYNVVNDRVVEIKNITVHRFDMGDVDDPDLYAAQPLWEWQQSDMGQWIMSHAVEAPLWHRMANVSIFGHSYAVTAKLLAKDYTYWALKWGIDIDRHTK